MRLRMRALAAFTAILLACATSGCEVAYRMVRDTHILRGEIDSLLNARAEKAIDSGDAATLAVIEGEEQKLAQACESILDAVIGKLLGRSEAEIDELSAFFENNNCLCTSDEVLIGPILRNDHPGVMRPAIADGTCGIPERSN